MAKNFLILFFGAVLFFSGAVAAENENEVDDAYVQKILVSQDEQAFDNLISQGLDVNSRDENGDTMLHYVLTHNKDLYMAKKLIDAGADVNLPSANGMTPLLVATSKANELQLQKMMLNNMDFEAQKEIVNAKVNEEIEYEMNRAIAMLQMLIEHGADVNKETPLGTPLMSASTSDWNTDMVEILLKNGAKVNQQDKNGRTALFYAQVFNCQQILQMLLQAGADIALKDNDGKTYIEVETNGFINQN
ncbi:MAG: ankyrin repeat domain-containing protein [Alphaproteobacteria bacterium]|nr:ankyrin repeat domain-containing protein [Alphaproteobacteria bacterium]